MSVLVAGEVTSPVDSSAGRAGVVIVLSELSAARQAEAQSRISQVRINNGEDAMSLVAHIAHGQESACGELPLDREHVVVDVGRLIAVVEERVRGQRRKVGPVNRFVWIGR